MTTMNQSDKSEDMAIYQNGEKILYGDAVSMNIIFNNMTGKNIKGEEYSKYKAFVKDEGFDLSQPFELRKNGKIINVGNFK